MTGHWSGSGDAAGANTAAADGNRYGALSLWWDEIGERIVPEHRSKVHTVPVYDHVLMTEPLSTVQMRSIGWRHRQGVGDSANRFHYYRLTEDRWILWGGYDVIYHFGRHVRDGYDQRPATFNRLAGHFFDTFPQLDGLRFTHRWGGAIDTCTRFCAFYGQAMRGQVAYALGYTGLGFDS